MSFFSKKNIFFGVWGHQIATLHSIVARNWGWIFKSKRKPKENGFLDLSDDIKQ